MNGFNRIKQLEDELGVTVIGNAFDFIDFYLDEGRTQEEIVRIFTPLVFVRIKRRKQKEAKALK
jgi:hypothetical protein